MMGPRIALAVAFIPACAGSSAGVQPDASTSSSTDAPATTSPDAALLDAGYPLTLDGNRERLLASYYAWLAASPDTTQSNGLSGKNLTGVCDLWSTLDPSSQDVFLTITHRLEHAVLADGTHALDHALRLYRVVGGQDANTSTAGSCGGGEYNRMFVSIDPTLHQTIVAANTHQGGAPYDLADITGSWRDSHDVAGPHTPFDLSDETNDGTPRGQIQFFRDPGSTAANSALGRLDLATLVDPYVLEMDHDYDCVHNSNPTCDYTFYGTACTPQSTKTGAELYLQNYGDFIQAWKPPGC